MFNKHVNLTIINLTKYDLFEIHSSDHIDPIYLHLSIPFTVLGVLLNLICIYVLLKPQFSSKPIFKYLRAYVMSSLIICLSFLFLILTLENQFFEFTSSLMAKFVRCFVLMPILSIMYIYSSLMNILITLERIYIFRPNLNYTNKLSWKTVCLISLIVCIALNMPFIISTRPSYTGLNEAFFNSFYGIAFMIFVYFIRDFVTLLVYFTLNVYLIVLLKRHLNYRESVLISNRILAHAPHLPVNSGKPFTIMVIIISTLSSIEHLITGLGCVYFLLSPDHVLIYILHVLFVVVLLKHSTNFLVFLIFNKKFQKVFLAMIK